MRRRLTAMGAVWGAVCVAVLWAGPVLAQPVPQLQPVPQAVPRLPELQLSTGEATRDMLLLHLTAQYTDTVVVGLLMGGMLGYLVSGRMSSVIVGSVLGLSLIHI